MRMIKTIFLFAVIVLGAAAILRANSAGPLPAHTAGFRESTCLQCHKSFKPNDGRTIGGVFEIYG
jgi:hypothetical protein